MGGCRESELEQTKAERREKARGRATELRQIGRGHQRWGLGNEGDLFWTCTSQEWGYCTCCSHQINMEKGSHYEAYFFFFFQKSLSP